MPQSTGFARSGLHDGAKVLPRVRHLMHCPRARHAAVKETRENALGILAPSPLTGDAGLAARHKGAARRTITDGSGFFMPAWAWTLRGMALRDQWRAVQGLPRGGAGSFVRSANPARSATPSLAALGGRF